MHIALEALRQTELSLEDLGILASNADQRAMALASTLAAIAALIATLASNTPSPLLSFITCALLVIASFLSASSCMPRAFHIRGHRWEDWYGHIKEGDSFYDAISAQAGENDNRIKTNYSRLEAAGKTTSRAFVMGFVTLCFFVGSQLGAVIQ